MKRIVLLLLTLSFCFALCACSSVKENSQPNADRQDVPESNIDEKEAMSDSTNNPDTANSDTSNTKILVAYFSRSGENYGVGEIEKGNTEIIAEMIAEETDADLFRIEAVNPYPTSYDECTEVAKQEQESGARPELADSLESLSDYDVIFLGYPIWWGDMPMPVYTFLESYDLTGKTIVPFCTHAGSGLAGTISTIRQEAPQATVLDGLAVPGTVAQNSTDEATADVLEFLQGLDD